MCISLLFLVIYGAFVCLYDSDVFYYVCVIILLYFNNFLDFFYFNKINEFRKSTQSQNCYKDGKHHIFNHFCW